MDTPLFFDQLCTECTSLLEANPLHLGHFGGYTHHLIIAKLRTSSTSGCRLCSLILNSILAKHERAIEPDGDSARQLENFEEAYHWLHFRRLDRDRVRLVAYANSQYKPLPISEFDITPLRTRERANILGRRAHISGTFGPSSLEQLKAWLETCLADHKTCRDSWTHITTHRRLPTRLLDVTDSAHLLKIRVIATSSLPIDTEYLTLSHRWGSVQPVMLTSKSHEMYSQGIPLSQLTETFEHAVRLTYLLGYQYLWIDSLCIIQDSQEDWRKESSMMGEIYANCLLNIAATASSDGSGGLFHQPANSPTSPLILKSLDESGNTEYYNCFPVDPWVNEVEEALLGKRGWVIQERILSPRVVHFASTQMFWDCCQERSAELLPPEAVGEDGELKKVAPYPESSEESDITQAWVYQNYNRLIERYTECDLTFESDKLVAFSGLARRLCHKLQLESTDYVAGLWRKTLLQDLLWRAQVWTPPGWSGPQLNRRRRVPGRAPSWSWASVEGPIRTLDNRAEQEIEQRLHVRVIDVATSHQRGNPFGQLEGGYIRVQGPVSAVRFGELSPNELHGRGVSFLWSGKGRYDTFWDDSASEVAADNGQCFLLIIQTHRIPGGIAPDYCGIILHPTGLKRGQFQRLGVILHEYMWGVTDVDTFLHNARNPELLEDAFYQEADPDLGFTIEII